MQVTNHSNNKRNMKEELLEAIYCTVERLEQKVDELSASPKNAGAETVLSSASIDTSKLEKAILSVSAKEEETIGKLAKLREAICVFVDLTKKEASKDEQQMVLPSNDPNVRYFSKVCSSFHWWLSSISVLSI